MKYHSLGSGKIWLLLAVFAALLAIAGCATVPSPTPTTTPTATSSTTPTTSVTPTPSASAASTPIPSECRKPQSHHSPARPLRGPRGSNHVSLLRAGSDRPVGAGGSCPGVLHGPRGAGPGEALCRDPIDVEARRVISVRRAKDARPGRSVPGISSPGHGSRSSGHRATVGALQ